MWVSGKDGLRGMINRARKGEGGEELRGARELDNWEEGRFIDIISYLNIWPVIFQCQYRFLALSLTSSFFYVKLVVHKHGSLADHQASIHSWNFPGAISIRVISFLRRLNSLEAVQATRNDKEVLERNALKKVLGLWLMALRSGEVGEDFCG